MKKLLLVAAMLTCSMAWAETAVTKESVKDEMLNGCIAHGNTETSCKCAIDRFEANLTKEDWDVSIMISQRHPGLTERHVEKLRAKMMKVAEGCGVIK